MKKIHKLLDNIAFLKLFKSRLKFQNNNNFQTKIIKLQIKIKKIKNKIC